MKKIFSVFLSLLLMLSLSVTAFAIPGEGAFQFVPKGITLDGTEIANGTEFETEISVYIDPSYDYIDVANLRMEFDSKLINFSGSIASVSDTKYLVSPMANPKNANQMFIGFGNLYMVAPSADGFCATITLNLKVVDAAALIAAGGTTITYSLFNDDLSAPKNGVMHNYWEVTGNTADYNMTVSLSPITITATSAAKTYTITYNTNGGNTIADASVTEGESVTLPTPTKAGHTFDGWYTEAALTTKVTSPFTPSANTTLYAKWTKDEDNDKTTYKITYETNGGATVAPTELNAETSTKLPTTTKKDYIFDGWYTDAALTKKAADPYTPTADTTLYAKWKKSSYSISFDTGGGSTINPDDFSSETPTKLPTPTKDGYIFDGWYTDAALTNRAPDPYTPSADGKLYAKWKVDPNAATTYTVKYETNGGSTIADASVVSGKSVTMPTPTKSGYTFAGWYTDAALKNKVSGTTYAPTANVTLYAKWTANASSTSNPKTGREDTLPILFGTLAMLVLCAGAIVFLQRKKMKHEK